MFAVDLEVRDEVSLARLTTLGIGGAARYFARARSREAVASGVAWAAERALPLLVIGGGSNILVADAGFPGLVLRVDVRGIQVFPGDGAIEVTVGAGERWASFVDWTVANHWAGVECLAGIPGLVGATPVQNVGAYGQEISDTITGIEALEIASGRVVHFNNAACGFGYRDSRFKRMDRHRYIILAVRFRLTPRGTPTVRYVELERLLHEREIIRPALYDVRAGVLELRRRKSMLLDTADPNSRSAGSFFLNPIITREAFTALQTTVDAMLRLGEPAPYHEHVDGRIKLSAAWLIEHTGFSRGHACGNVGLSSKHTLALINRGGATAHELLTFARIIRNRVYDRFGIVLMPEPTFVGLSLDEEPHSLSAT